RFIEKNPGPWPKLRGMIWSPGFGLMSNAPKGVTLRSCSGVVLEAKAGRSVVSESLFRSLPIVILKGAPEDIIANGLIVTCLGRLIVANTNPRCRTSNEDLPNSLLRSYE